MKLAVNTVKGTEIKHPELGSLPSQVAIPIKDEDTLLAESINGVVVINEVLNNSRDKIEIDEIVGDKK